MPGHAYFTQNPRKKLPRSPLHCARSNLTERQPPGAHVIQCNTWSRLHFFLKRPGRLSFVYGDASRCQDGASTNLFLHPPAAAESSRSRSVSTCFPLLWNRQQLYLNGRSPQPPAGSDASLCQLRPDNGLHSHKRRLLCIFFLRPRN